MKFDSTSVNGEAGVGSFEQMQFAMQVSPASCSVTESIASSRPRAYSSDSNSQSSPRLHSSPPRSALKGKKEQPSSSWLTCLAVITSFCGDSRVTADDRMKKHHDRLGAVRDAASKRLEREESHRERSGSSFRRRRADSDSLPPSSMRRRADSDSLNPSSFFPH